MSNLKILYEVDWKLALGALAGDDVAVEPSAQIELTNEQGFRVQKLRWAGYYSGKTTSQGGIAWGIACNFEDATAAAQIETILEAQPGSAQAADGRQTDSWWIKTMGVIPFIGTDGMLDGGTDGMIMLDCDVNWSVPEGSSMFLWAHNMSGSGLTTGTVIDLYAEIYGVWLRD